MKKMTFIFVKTLLSTLVAAGIDINRISYFDGPGDT
jgi:hypothetical protein